jgi:lambda repressor-like predicted transcriptional regulator
MPERWWDGLTPAQIVAALHAEIAAMSPERAALVAEWDAMRAGLRAAQESGLAPVPRPGAVAVVAYHQDRVRRYRELREAGLSLAQAAEQLGVSPRTAENYGGRPARSPRL